MNIPCMALKHNEQTAAFVTVPTMLCSIKMSYEPDLVFLVSSLSFPSVCLFLLERSSNDNHAIADLQPKVSTHSELTAFTGH